MTTRKKTEKKKTATTEPATRKKPTRMSDHFVDSLFKVSGEGAIFVSRMNQLAEVVTHFDAYLVIHQEKEDRAELSDIPFFQNEAEAAIALVSAIKKVEALLITSRAQLKEHPHTGMIVSRFNYLLDQWEKRTGVCWGFVTDKF